MTWPPHEPILQEIPAHIARLVRVKLLRHINGHGFMLVKVGERQGERFSSSGGGWGVVSIRVYWFCGWPIYFRSSGGWSVVDRCGPGDRGGGRAAGQMQGCAFGLRSFVGLPQEWERLCTIIPASQCRTPVPGCIRHAYSTPISARPVVQCSATLWCARVVSRREYERSGDRAGRWARRRLGATWCWVSTHHLQLVCASHDV